MSVPIFFWHRHTVALSGRAARPITCEECGTAYPYEMERAGVGHGWSLYAIGVDGAERRAGERARGRLAEKLGREQDVVPCPKCGWIQSGMVPVAKRDHLRWLDTAGWLVVFLAMTVGFLNAATGFGDPHGSPPVPWPIAASCAAVGLFLILLRHALAAQHDPNAEHVEVRLALGQERATVAPGRFYARFTATIVTSSSFFAPPVKSRSAPRTESRIASGSCFAAPERAPSRRSWPNSSPPAPLASVTPSV